MVPTPYSEDRRSLSAVAPLAGSFFFGMSQLILLLFLTSLWPVFVRKLRKLGRCLTVQGLGELQEVLTAICSPLLLQMNGLGRDLFGARCLI